MSSCSIAEYFSVFDKNRCSERLHVLAYGVKDVRALTTE